jgi:hypothetical protein
LVAPADEFLTTDVLLKDSLLLVGPRSSLAGLPPGYRFSVSAGLNSGGGGLHSGSGGANGGGGGVTRAVMDWGRGLQQRYGTGMFAAGSTEAGGLAAALAAPSASASSEASAAPTAPAAPAVNSPQTTRKRKATRKRGALSANPLVEQLSYTTALGEYYDYLAWGHWNISKTGTPEEALLNVSKHFKVGQSD